MTPYDSDVELSIELCRLLGVKVIIRGTDDDPKVIMKCRWTLKPLGGLDLRHRMKKFRGEVDGAIERADLRQSDA